MTRAERGLSMFGPNGLRSYSHKVDDASRVVSISSLCIYRFIPLAVHAHSSDGAAVVPSKKPRPATLPSQRKKPDQFAAAGEAHNPMAPETSGVVFFLEWTFEDLTLGGLDAIDGSSPTCALRLVAPPSPSPLLYQPDLPLLPRVSELDPLYF